MDFSFTEEQTMLEESVTKLMQNDYGFEVRQKHSKSELGFSAQNWSTFAELGWLGVAFSEADGGFGGGAIEAMLMAEIFGKSLVVEPYLATVVLAGGAIKHGGNAAQKEKHIPGIIDGSVQGALAYAEPQGRFNLSDLTTTASKADGGYLINGYKAVVLNGPAADLLVVSARTSGEQRDAQGVSLFIVDANAAGITRRDYPTVDGLRAVRDYL